MKKTLLYAVLGVAGLAAAAIAQTIVVPQVSSIGSTDLIQVIPNGQPSAQSRYAPAPLLGNYSPTLAGNNPENALIGGDATTNLWQRATTGSSVTTTLTYGGPDRWAYWSGTSTAMTVSRSNTSGDLPATYQYGFKMARTAAQTGVVQMCMMQVLETVNSMQFAGQTAEVDFHAATGSTFSAASANMVVYFISGTGTDGSASTAAFNLNAGGGGSSTWTGQVNTGVTVSLGAVSTLGRYTAVAPIPSNAAQIAIALCWTPVGTAGANDYVTFSGIQLTRNSALTTVAGTTGAALSVNDTRAKAFARRTQAQETIAQQRYYYRVTETAAIFPVAPCAAVDTTHTNCFVKAPATMRTAPTLTFANGFATPTSTTQATLGACTTLSAATTVSSTVGGVDGFLVNCAASTVPAAGIASFLYSNNGSGTISASAEL
jgi:hypothetical protein